VEIIAHRGSSFIAPENTLAAIRLGWEEGADAAESDFRLTRDGRIVSIHDATMKRTAGVDWNVADHTLAELQTLDVGGWKGPQWQGQRIATLEDCLATTPPGKRFFVEIKAGVEIVPELARVVRAADQPLRQMALMSLSWEVVTAIKQSLPEATVYHVTQFEWDKATARWTPSQEEILAKAKQAGVDGLDLMGGGPLDAAMIAAFAEAGLDRCAWTVDDPQLARHLLSLGVTGITTNRPGWLRQQLENPSP
jgi:glycerophosphoryl diester phosphodiesterase